jgi:hypothetical protein
MLMRSLLLLLLVELVLLQQMLGGVSVAVATRVLAYWPMEGAGKEGRLKGGGRWGRAREDGRGWALLAAGGGEGLLDYLLVC